jgi:hypothetical protein
MQCKERDREARCRQGREGIKLYAFIAVQWLPFLGAQLAHCGVRGTHHGWIAIFMSALLSIKCHCGPLGGSFASLHMHCRQLRLGALQRAALRSAASTQHS